MSSHAIVEVDNEIEMISAITIILNSESKVSVLPAPDGLTIKDIFPEGVTKAIDFQESTAENWKRLAKETYIGFQVFYLRKALGLNQTEFAKRWGTKPSGISQLENSNRKLNQNSKLKIYKIVLNRINELS